MEQGGTRSGFPSLSGGRGGSTSLSTIKTITACRLSNALRGTEMKTPFNPKWGFIGLWVITSTTAASAHEIPVHEAITANAAASAFTYSPAYRDFLNTVSLDCDLMIATNAMV